MVFKNWNRYNINTNNLNPIYQVNISSNVQQQFDSKLDISDNNIVDGVTKTKKDIRYISGSSFNVQTQIKKFNNFCYKFKQ